MIHENCLIKIFCEMDDFCKQMEPAWFRKVLTSSTKSRVREGQLCLSEIMTIVVYFHTSGHRDFKHYFNDLRMWHTHYFPNIVTYNQFVEIMKICILPLICFMEHTKGEKTAMNIIDSTSLIVCGNKRIRSNKVFKNLAKIGKTTMGWFFGFKLHTVINEKGEILSFQLTRGNVDDMSTVPYLTKNLWGKLFA